MNDPSRPLRVALVDTSPRHLPSSMRRYADLVAEAVGSVEDGHRVDLLRVSLSPPPALSSLLPVRLEPWGRRVWARTVGAAAWRGVGADLVHVTDAMTGLSLTLPARVPVVATVHDVIPLLQMHSRFGARPPSRLARHVIRRTVRALKGAKALIADSLCTARDLVEVAGVSGERITTIPLAVPSALLKAPVTNGAAPAPRYLLHVGSGAFYKNRHGLLRIFARVRRQADVRLVLAGLPPDDAAQRLAAELGLTPFIDVHSLPSDAALAHLYRHAAALLMPSLYEGYGWPVLEAMALGCPVVCSSAGALPEVAGDAALVRAPEDEPGFARAVLDILGDADLAHRLRAGGLLQAAPITVEDMGRRLRAVYERVAER